MGTGGYTTGLEPGKVKDGTVGGLPGDVQVYVCPPPMEMLAGFNAHTSVGCTKAKIEGSEYVTILMVLKSEQTLFALVTE